MKHLKKILFLTGTLLLLCLLVACEAQDPNEPAATSAQSTDAVTTQAPATTEEPDPLAPEGALTVDPTKHDPLLLWENRAKTPYWDDSFTDMIDPHLLPYLIGDGEKRGCVIVCPGGGYRNRSSEHEGTTVAEFINANWDMNAFVLEYRVAPADYRASMSDVQRAIRYVRYYAKDLGVDPNKIVIMGFSAGGHLACMAAEKFTNAQQGDAIDKVSSRPDAAVLCYPVITLSEDWKHVGSANNFLGAQKDNEALAKEYSGEKAVRVDMPPVFVLHSKKDPTVSYKNSEELANAMLKLKLSCTLKLYESGGHGFGLALGKTHDSAKWTADCFAWLKEVGIK